MSRRPRVLFVITDGRGALHSDVSDTASTQPHVTFMPNDRDRVLASRAKRVVFVRSGTQILPELAATLEASRGSGALVPGIAARLDQAQLTVAAVTTEGTAVPLKAALAALDGPASEDPVVLRGRALAWLPVRVRAVACAGLAEPQAASTTVQAVRDLAARFTELSSVRSTSVVVNRALDVVRREIARSVGLLVKADPAKRSECLDALAESRALGFDMRAMNAASATTLAVTYAFPPFLDTSGFVTARRFALAGTPYDVVTQDMAGHRPLDERSLALADRELGDTLLVRGRAAFGSWVTIEKFCRAGMKQIEDAESAKGAYQHLYSRSMWAASTVLAAWYKARHPHTPWVAELSDPLVQRPNGERRPNPFPDNDILREIDSAARALGRNGFSGEGFFEAVEWMAYALADEIIFTNENQRDFMLGDFYDSELAERARSVSRISHHPVPPPELYTVTPPIDTLPADVITVAYFGRFYAVRGVEDLLAPFAALEPDERSRLRLLIFTTDLEETREAVAAHPAADCVEVRAALPYFEFLATASAVDWLVVADARRPPEFSINPYLPSKLADYLGSGTPVWGLVEPGSVMSREPLAAMSTLGDVDAAVEVLRSTILRSRD